MAGDLSQPAMQPSVDTIQHVCGPRMSQLCFDAATACAHVEAGELAGRAPLVREQTVRRPHVAVHQGRRVEAG